MSFAAPKGRTGANVTSEFDASPVELRHTVCDVCLRVLFLRQRHGMIARIAMCRVDVKEAIRQIPVDPVVLPYSVIWRTTRSLRNSPGIGVFNRGVEAVP